MNLQKRGSATIITIIALVALGVGTLASALIVSNRKKPQSVSTKAAQTVQVTPSCNGVNTPVSFDPANYSWDADCESTKYLIETVNGVRAPLYDNKSCYWTDDTSNKQEYNKFCKQSTSGYIDGPTSNWCYPFGPNHEDFRCMQLVYIGTGGGNPPGTIPPEPTQSGGGGGGGVIPPGDGGGGGGGNPIPTSTTISPTPANECEKQGGLCNEAGFVCQTGFHEYWGLGCAKETPVCCYPNTCKDAGHVCVKYSTCSQNNDKQYTYEPVPAQLKKQYDESCKNETGKYCCDKILPTSTPTPTPKKDQNQCIYPNAGATKSTGINYDDLILSEGQKSCAKNDKYGKNWLLECKIGGTKYSADCSLRGQVCKNNECIDPPQSEPTLTLSISECHPINCPFPNEAINNIWGKCMNQSGGGCGRMNYFKTANCSNEDLIGYVENGQISNKLNNYCSSQYRPVVINMTFSYSGAPNFKPINQGGLVWLAIGVNLGNGWTNIWSKTLTENDLLTNPIVVNNEKSDIALSDVPNGKFHSLQAFFCYENLSKYIDCSIRSQKFSFPSGTDPTINIVFQGQF